MSTIKNFVNNHHYISGLLFVLLGLALIIALSACGTPAASTPDPEAKSATVEETLEEAPEAETTPPPVNNFIKPFGDVVSYEDGVSISVALVGPFTPTNLDYMPLAEGETAVAFKVVLTNNSTDVIEPAAIAEANSGGKPASYLSDIGNPEFGDIGIFPTTSILPGQTLEWFVGFGVADPADVTLEISPTLFDHDTAIFTTASF